MKDGAWPRVIEKGSGDKHFSHPIIEGTRCYLVGICYAKEQYSGQCCTLTMRMRKRKKNYYNYIEGERNTFRRGRTRNTHWGESNNTNEVLIAMIYRCYIMLHNIVPA